MNRTEEEQDVFEKLTLRDFKMQSSTALKTSKKWSVMMTSNKNIMSVVLLSLFLVFELIQEATMVNYTLLLGILNILNEK